MQDVGGGGPPGPREPGSDPPAAGGGGPRASDADRDRFASLLEHHFAEGRLTAEEFEERMDRVLHARTLGELYALAADLPDLPAVVVRRVRGAEKRRSWRFWRAR